MTGMMTSKYNTKKNEPLVEGEERELQFQGQPGLHKKFGQFKLHSECHVKTVHIT